jgi:hypothetical protein
LHHCTGSDRPKSKLQTTPAGDACKIQVVVRARIGKETAE